MDSSKSISLIKEIRVNCNQWKVIQIVCDNTFFQKTLKTPSRFYRKLTNSKSSIGGITNREYFKGVTIGGGYFFKTDKSNIKLYLCLKGETLSNIQLMVRIRKILPVSQVVILEDLPDTVINNYQFQPVGEYYFTLS
jgi:hypothetical protein